MKQSLLEQKTLQNMARSLSLRHRGVYDIERNLAGWTKYPRSTGWDMRCPNCHGGRKYTIGYTYDGFPIKDNCPTCKGTGHKVPGKVYQFAGSKSLAQVKVGDLVYQVGGGAQYKIVDIDHLGNASLVTLAMFTKDGGKHPIHKGTGYLFPVE